MILKDLISGIDITTLGFPSNLGNLASMSPNVLVTFYHKNLTLILIYLYLLIIFQAILEMVHIYIEDDLYHSNLHLL
jgi:hypothetical protein